jgi:putative membrane protein
LVTSSLAKPLLLPLFFLYLVKSLQLKNKKMDKEETKSNNSAWSIGWGWYLTVPLLVILGLAAKKGVNETLVKHQPAMDILKERYAKGEIDRAKFEEMINDILAI